MLAQAENMKQRTSKRDAVIFMSRVVESQGSALYGDALHIKIYADNKKVQVTRVLRKARQSDSPLLNLDRVPGTGF